MNPLEKAWRKRAAFRLRSFRKQRGYWPDRQILEAMKRGIQKAIAQGIQPRVEH